MTALAWRAIGLAVLALAPAMAGLSTSADANEEPVAYLGERAYALVMEGNRFNTETWPETPLLEAYEGEQMQFLVHVPINAEMHTFHLHGHPWQDRETGDFVDAERLDAGETLTFEQTAGLGQDRAGDWFYHCHVGTHFGTGMWGLLRVYPYAMQIEGPLGGLTVTLLDDGQGLEDATFTATLRDNVPDTPTAAEATAGDPVALDVTELGDGRYRVVPSLVTGAIGELVLESHHVDGESIARLDLTATGYTLDRDVSPPSDAPIEEALDLLDPPNGDPALGLQER